MPLIEHELPRPREQLLDPAARAFIGPAFAHDFSRIPAHSRSLLGIQAKLTVNVPGDIYEQEADRIADQVLAASAHLIVGGPSRVQRFPMQPAGQAIEAPASVDRALASPGRPLEAALRQDMEQRFGHDFSRVRVHTGPAAEQSARDVNAHAYTAGHDIVFGAEKFVPGTDEGRRLIAHELTHTIQQGGAAIATSGRANTTGWLPPGISNVAWQVSGLVQRSWIGDRIDWVRSATHEDNWASSDPPGAYYVLNGLSMDDMVRVLRVLTPADRKKLSDNLDEHAAGFDRLRLRLALAKVTTATRDASIELTNDPTLTPAKLKAMGYRFKDDSGGVPKWVHPSGKELWLMSLSEARSRPSLKRLAQRLVHHNTSFKFYNLSII